MRHLLNLAGLVATLALAGLYPGPVTVTCFALALVVSLASLFLDREEHTRPDEL